MHTHTHTHTHTHSQVSLIWSPSKSHRARFRASLLVLQKLLQSFPVLGGHLDGTGRTGLEIHNVTLFFPWLNDKTKRGAVLTGSLTSSVARRWWLSCRWRSWGWPWGRSAASCMCSRPCCRPSAGACWRRGAAWSGGPPPGGVRREDGTRWIQTQHKYGYEKESCLTGAGEIRFN